MRIYNFPSEAYLGTLDDVLYNPDSTSAPRGQNVREKFNYQFTILHPDLNPIVTKDLERNEIIRDYSEKEFELYNSQSNKVKDFEKASKFWGKLANPDGTINSAYGYLIWKNRSHGCDFEKRPEPHPAFSPYDGLEVGPVMEMVGVRRTPWEWCYESLKADRDTRQAVLRFSLPEHFWVGNRDFTCTLHGVFSIRNNKLNLTINMRSNDLMLGLVYDLPWFQSLIYKMREDLAQTYPDLEIGSYTHYVHNMHVYDRDLEKIYKMLGEIA